MTEIKKASATKVSGGKDDPGRKDAPDQGLPTDPKPDQGLPPGSPGAPDQTLPGSPARPDQGLPGEPPYPDQGLPERPTQGFPGSPDNTLPGQPPSGADRPIDPDYGVDEGGRPDNSLPGSPNRPDNTLPGQPNRPDNTLPPGSPGSPDNTLPGDLPNVDNELPPVDPDEIMDDIAHAEKLEVVYCDGNGPIGIPALKVSKSDLKMTSNGLKLEQQEVLIFGPGREQRAYELDGYALIADGSQIAYAKRPEPLTVGNGMTMNVADDIIFPVTDRKRDTDDGGKSRR